MENFLALIHWSFFSVGLLVSVIVKFMQMLKTRLVVSAWYELISDSYLFSALLGIFIGIIPGIPAPEVIGSEIGLSHVLYFSTAGILGSWIFALIEKILTKILPIEFKQWLEKKLGTEGGDDKEDENEEEEPGINDDTKD